MENSKHVICTCCPKECGIDVELLDGKVVNVTGYTCKNGKTYAVAEVTNPIRNISGIVSSAKSLEPVSVKTSKPIPKEKIKEVAETINATTLNDSVKIGDVVIADVCGTGADIIATKSI